MLTQIENILYTFYHYLSLISIILAMFTIGIAIKRKSRHLEHSTAIILMAFFFAVCFLKSIVASALTIGIINFDVALNDHRTINTNLVIMGLTIYLKFIIFLVVFDLWLRAKFYQSYGNSIFSIFVCIFGLSVTGAASILLAGAVIFIKQAGLSFLSYYRITTCIVQFLSILATAYLYYFINNLRRKSFSSSSLSLRHECVKNLMLLRNYFPMVSIDAMIGTFALLITILGSQFLNFPLTTTFPIFYVLMEISTILTFLGLIRTLHKTNRIGVFSGIFASSQTEISISVVSVRTMIHEIPTAISHEDYFRKLQQAWN